jgi:hypothetical protein
MFNHSWIDFYFSLNLSAHPIINKSLPDFQVIMTESVINRLLNQGSGHGNWSPG